METGLFESLMLTNIPRESVQKEAAFCAINLSQAFKHHWDDNLVRYRSCCADKRTGLDTPISLVQNVCTQK